MINNLYFSYFRQNMRCFYIADLELPGDRNTELHTHDFYEFLVVLSGSFIHELNGKKTKLEKGMAQIIRPCDMHGFLPADTNTKSVLRNIAVEKDVFIRELVKSEIVNESEIGNIDAFPVSSLDHDALHLYKEKTSGLLFGSDTESFKEYLFFNILSDFLLRYKKEKNLADIPLWLLHTCNEMHKKDNYVEGLPRMVEISQKSQEHLTRSVRQYYNMTPTEYINQIRLQNAAAMLQKSDMKIIDIIFECGYNSLSYFNRLFKMYYGLSPREYREFNYKIF